MIRQLALRLRRLAEPTNLNPVRRRRITRIKRLIESGQYHVSAIDVADAIIDGRYYEFDSLVGDEGERLDRMDLEAFWDDLEPDEAHVIDIRSWISRQSERDSRWDPEHRKRHPSAWRPEEIPPPGELPRPR